MSDIVERIRSLRYVHVPVASQLLEEAANEIERLRLQPCPYVTGKTTLHCTLTPFTLTDAEREAVKLAVYLINTKMCGDTVALRGLLERTK